MKPSTVRFVAIGLLWAVALLFSYIIVFAFYVAGLFGDGTSVPPEVWERTLKATVLLGTTLSGFLVLCTLAWAGRWGTGLVPWAAGAIAVLLLARKDAGILQWIDGLWVVPLLFAAWYATRGRGEPPEE